MRCYKRADIVAVGMTDKIGARRTHRLPQRREFLLAEPVSHQRRGIGLRDVTRHAVVAGPGR
jgi:hypothetical protein